MKVDVKVWELVERDFLLVFSENCKVTQLGEDILMGRFMVALKVDTEDGLEYGFTFSYDLLTEDTMSIVSTKDGLRIIKSIKNGKLEE